MRLNSTLLTLALLMAPGCGSNPPRSLVLELTDADISPYMKKLEELSAATGKRFVKAPSWPWSRSLTVIGYLHRELIGNEKRLAALRARPEPVVLLTSTHPEDHDAAAINVICDGNYPKYFVWDLDK